MAIRNKLMRNERHPTEANIAKSKPAKEELRRSEEIFRALIENSSDGITVLDADGGLCYESPSISRMLGYEPGSTIGKTSFELVHPDDMPNVTHSLSQLLQNPGVTVQLEVRVLHRDGSWRTIEVVARNLLEDPVVEGIVINQRDITERKQVEEALRESERKFKSFVEQMNDGYCVIQDSQIVFANTRIAAMFGYTQDEVIGKDIHRFLSPETAWQLVEAHAKRRRGETVPPQYETVLTTKDGTSYPIEFSTRLIEYAGRPATSVLVRDITERKKAEEAMRHKEQHFRALIENAQDAIVILSGDGIIRYESPSMARVLGHNPEDRIGTNPFDVVHPDDVPAAADLFAQVLRTSGDRVNTEVRVQHEDGSWRTVEVVAHNLLDDLAVAGVVVNIRDITERKQAEETLREGEEHYSALVENLSDAVFHLRDGIVVWCNDKVNQIYGYTKDELIGKDISFFQPYETDHLRFINEGYAMIKERGHFRGTTRSKAKDGGMVDIEYSIAKIPGRYPIELVAVARNVTERKRMEEQLHVAGRLAAVGELAAGVAHELNNPLTAVQAFAEFLAEKQDLDDTIKDDIQTIYQESQRAARITSNLLSFARERKPEKRLISINEALDKSLELYSYRLKVNNIELVRELHPSLSWTMADFHQMQQVFVNIITNAEQSMTKAHGKGKLIVKTQKKGNVIQITFSDDGPGISEEDLKRMFDPFFTTKEVGEGTGLGLSICYGIVQEHGGTLYAKSKLGDGATFTVEIPIVQEQISDEQVELTAPWGI